MDTILHVVFIIFVIFLYGTMLAIPLYFGLLALLGILVFICRCGEKFCEWLGGKPTYEDLMRMYDDGLRAPCFLEELEAKRAELERTKSVYAIGDMKIVEEAQ